MESVDSQNEQRKIQILLKTLQNAQLKALVNIVFS